MTAYVNLPDPDLATDDEVEDVQLDLQQAITAEGNARAVRDLEIEELIDAEGTTRTSAIQAEATARIAADAALAEDIDAEALARAAADDVTLSTANAYTDSALSLLTLKDPVRAVMTTNVNISSPGSTFDTVLFSNSGVDDLLLTGQSVPAQNGIYVWNGASSPLTRRADANSSPEMTPGLLVLVTEGSEPNAGKIWRLQTPAPITLGTTALTFGIAAGATTGLATSSELADEATARQGVASDLADEVARAIAAEDAKVDIDSDTGRAVAEQSYMQTIQGVAPNSDGEVALDPETAFGIEFLDGQYIQDPSGGNAGDIPTLTDPSLRTVAWAAPSGASSASVIEGVALFARYRKRPLIPSGLANIATASAAVQNFQTGHGWTLSGGGTGAAANPDTTKYMEGTQSYRISAGIDSSVLTYWESPTFSSPVDLTNHYLEFMINRSEIGAAGSSLLGGFFVEVSSNGGSTWVQCDTRWRQSQKINRWERARAHRGSFKNSQTNFSATTWTAINKVRIASRTDTAASSPVSWWIQSMRLGSSPANASLTFVIEARQTIYDNFAMFAQRGIFPNIGYRAGAVDTHTNGSMTADNLKELCWSFGCDAAPMCWDHTDWDSSVITDAAMETSIARAIHYGIKNRFPIDNGWRCGGTWATVNVPRAQLYSDRYSNIGGLQTFDTSDACNVVPTPGNQALAHFLSGSSVVTLATAYIDKVIACKGWGLIRLNELTTGTTASGTINISQMAQVLDYAVTSGIELVTMTEMGTRQLV